MTPLSPRTTAAPKSPHPAVGRGVRFVFASFLLLPLAACATKSDVRDLRTEIRELNARQEALIHELREAQEAQEDSLQVVAEQLFEQSVEVTRGFRSVEDQLIRVQELVGVSQGEIASLRDQMDRRPAVPERISGSTTQTGGEAQDVYDVALQQYRRDQFFSASMAFEEIVARWPNHELTPSARYYIADILVQQGELDAALDAFEQIAEYHPDADRVPDALFRIGTIHQERGELEEARGYFQRVVNTWPDSQAAVLAREELENLG